MNATQIMQRITQRRGVRQFVKFGIVGASGTAVNLVIYTIILNLTPAAERSRILMLIYSVAFLAGGVSNYLLNRLWTFRATGHALVQGIQFLIVSAIALGVAAIVSAVFQPMLGPGHKLWLVMTLFAVPVNFFINKYWTFRAAA